MKDHTFYRYIHVSNIAHLLTSYPQKYLSLHIPDSFIDKFQGEPFVQVIDHFSFFCGLLKRMFFIIILNFYVALKYFLLLHLVFFIDTLRKNIIVLHALTEMTLK